MIRVAYLNRSAVVEWSDSPTSMMYAPTPTIRMGRNRNQSSSNQLAMVATATVKRTTAAETLARPTLPGPFCI